MGKRKFALSKPTKNAERKRWGFSPVKIPLDAVSVYNVSIPLEYISLNVTLPLSSLKYALASSPAVIRSRISVLGLLPSSTELSLPF